MRAHRRYATVASGLCATYAAATSAWYAVWRAGFAERSADEGMFENLLWNALHGNGLRTSMEGGLPHLSVHFSPALYALLPLYAMFPSMHVVHFLTAALIAVAGFVFFCHVADTLDERAALPALIAFLLCPTIVLQTFMEFHEQALAVLPLTMLIVSWSRGRRSGILWSALALLSIREDNALLVVALGITTLFDARRRSTGGVLVLLGVLWLVAWRALVLPMLGGQTPGVLGNTYSSWGTTPSEIVFAILSHPLDALKHILAPVPLQYLALLLAPTLGLLAFGSPFVVALLPQLLMILLAEHDSRMLQIRMHYSVAPAVILLFAAVSTLGRFRTATSGPPAWLRRWAPVAMMFITLVMAPSWALRARARLNPWSAQIREVLAQIPDSGSVAAPGYLLNHLAARPGLELMWRAELPNTRYVILEDSSRFFLQSTTVDVFFTPALDSLLRAGGHELVSERQGWHFYRRSPVSAPE